MNYSKVIDVDSVTLEDCINLYENDKTIFINDGRIVEIKGE